MAKPARPASYDVWFVAADTVYKGVPADVLLGWAEQGRVAAADKFRPAGTATAWGRVGADPFFAGFLYRGGTPAASTGAVAAREELEPVEPAGLTVRGEEEDDDPDMIPLIDVSLVLLIFFMLTSVVSSMSPVDVPTMRRAGELSKEQEAISIIIDRRAGDDVVYAVRVGEKPIAAEDNNLSSPEDAIKRLDVHLAGATKAPAVRVAGHRKLPVDRVDEIALELDRRQREGRINFFELEVTEKK